MPKRKRQRVAVVTGSRADFGLLAPVMRAIARHPNLSLNVIAAGSHLLPPARTIRDVAAAFPIAARVPMQRPLAPSAPRTRHQDALSVARGIQGFARTLDLLNPDWVLVLGDRIEAFAAAAAAAISGRAVAHIHGGDRAEGIADESMRHAVSKLAHLHCAATTESAERLHRMGELPAHIVTTGSPAIDDLADIQPMTDADAAALGDPQAVILHHPAGLSTERERALVHAIMYGVEEMSAGNVLCLAPNADAGREVIDEALRARCARTSFEVAYTFPRRAGIEPRPTFKPLARRARSPVCGVERQWRFVEHLPRRDFLALLKRLAPTDDSMGGLLIGNSSAGLIEAAAIGLRVINVGPRQDGRERPPIVVDVPESEIHIIGTRVDWALSLDLPEPGPPAHPFGDGRAGHNIAAALAARSAHDPALLRKRNAY
ncbi:MAG: UDP-N-acetylglucosamine 2-epimerase [Phycisphaerales bacterium]